jgi:hypothetical protein
MGSKCDGPCSRPESETIHYSVVERLTGDFAVRIDDLILRFRKDREGRYPPPLIFWNDEVTARLPPKSLRNKDLYLKYSGIRS